MGQKSFVFSMWSKLKCQQQQLLLYFVILYPVTVAISMLVSVYFICCPVAFVFYFEIINIFSCLNCDNLSQSTKATKSATTVLKKHKHHIVSKKLIKKGGLFFNMSVTCFYSLFYFISYYSILF